nr:UDP-N-acetylmuramoyl-L-alanyl-D-glutamate--2,6-diaminopimelate ligase [Pseudomonadota bacterium]
MNLNLRQFADECGAHLLGGGGETALAGITHDSRTVEAGDLFVCLVGLHSRGENFLAQAAARGAVAA